MRKGINLLTTFVLLILRLSAQESKPFALVDVNIVDVESGKIIRNQIAIINKDRIADIIPLKAKPDLSGYKVIQGNENFLMPGLIDTHLHLFYYISNKKWDELKLMFKLMLANGITGVREAGASVYTEQMIAVRDSLRKQYFPGPCIYVSGIATNSNLKKFQSKNYSELVDTFNKIGVDGIKIKFATFSETKEIIDAANRHNLIVYGHTYNNWRNETSNILGDFTPEAVDYGIKGVMHMGFTPIGKNVLPPGPEPVYTSTSKFWEKWWLYFDALWLHTDKQAEQKLITNMVSKKVWLEPTLSTADPLMNHEKMMRKKARQYYFLPDSSLIEGFPHPTGIYLDTARMAFRKSQEFVKKFYDAGGLLLAGTDGSLYGSDLRDELRYLVEAGIPIPAVIKIVTYNNALALGWLNEMGTVSKGKLANLILLKKNPLLNISSLENIEAVISNGNYYNKQTLNKWLSEISIAALNEKITKKIP